LLNLDSPIPLRHLSAAFSTPPIRSCPLRLQKSRGIRPAAKGALAGKKLGCAPTGQFG
jgi:hypothetical protein